MLGAGTPRGPWTPAGHRCGQYSGSWGKEWPPHQGLQASDPLAPQDRGPEQLLETPQNGPRLERRGCVHPLHGGGRTPVRKGRGQS